VFGRPVAVPGEQSLQIVDRRAARVRPYFIPVGSEAFRSREQDTTAGVDDPIRQFADERVPDRSRRFSQVATDDTDREITKSRSTGV